MNGPDWTPQKLQYWDVSGILEFHITCKAAHSPNKRHETIHSTPPRTAYHPRTIFKAPPYPLVHFTRWYTFTPCHVPYLRLPIIPDTQHNIIIRRVGKRLLLFSQSLLCVSLTKGSHAWSIKAHVEVRAIFRTTNFTQGGEVYDCRDNRCSTVGVVRVNFDWDSYSLGRGHTSSGAV